MSDAKKKLDLILLWHMHQPDYRDHLTGEFRRPWTYLHALKDYTDMAAHLERHSQVHAVVNFVPVLLDQIEDYVQQFDSGVLRDRLLRLLAHDNLDALDADDRNYIVATCIPGDRGRLAQPFPHFDRLYKLYRQLDDDELATRYFSGAYFADLLVWYHLAWTGETERRSQPLLAELLAKAQNYTLQDRRALLALIGDTLRRVIPRYRALAERGQIEISTTPHAHPLAPLLLSFASAREAQPDIPLPLATEYPGGRSRVDAHILTAKQSHAARFGQPPRGIWPAEGALSTALLQQFAGHGFLWTASSEAVLANSLRAYARLDATYLYRPWQVEGAPGLSIFFRDEKLSDLIGFEYAKWHGRDAAQHFVTQLENIRDGAPANEPPVVCVFLDGENAWEYYPYNGYHFFEDLYGLIDAQDWLHTCTCTQWLAQNPQGDDVLPGLVAGSWVYGTFSTWIGDAAKNRAWDLLCTAKQSYDLVMDSGRLDEAGRAAAEAQLSVCEGSDWFWWFGDYNPREAVESFDQLFRANLAHLYRLLHLAEPAQLAVPLSRGGDIQTEAGGTMRRAN